MRILALDLATLLGWACGDSELGDPVSGVKKLPSTGENVGAFLDAYHGWLIEKLKEQEPSLIVMEAPISAQGMTTMTTLMKLWGLCSHTEFVAAHKGIECRQVPAGTWKKSVTGSGATKKPKLVSQAAEYAVVRVCHEMGWDHVLDNNEADALGIFIYAVRACDPASSVRFDPLMRAAQFQLSA